MNSIDVRRPLALTPRQAHAVLQAVAEELSERYGAGYRWDQDTLRFSRFGLRGYVELSPGQAHVHVELGLLFLSNRDRLEQGIAAFLDHPPASADAKAVRQALRGVLSVTSHDRPPPRPVRKARPKPPPASAPASPAIDLPATGALPVTARQAAQRQSKQGDA